MPPTQNDYAKIGIARKQLHLSEEEYRDILAMNCNGKTSAKELTPAELATLYAVFAAKGWRPTSPDEVKDGHKNAKKVSDNYRRIPAGPAAKQQRYCLALWTKLGYEVKKLDSYCHKRFNIDRIEWVTEQQSLNIIITDLRQRCISVGLDPDSK